MNNKALFLHWGPGANASVERLWFKDFLAVHWWDQPLSYSSPDSAWLETVAAAEVELQSLYRVQGPTPLIAHSFGGQIALELARKVPHMIANLTLMACGARPYRSFLHLGRKLGLGARVEALEARFSVEGYWDLIQAIGGTPDFLNHYWHSSTARARYFERVALAKPMDMGAFAALMSVFIANRECPVSPGVSSLPVRALFGEYDPLQNMEEELSDWRMIFPNVKIEKLPVGHFPHFELAPEVWMPAI